MRFIKFGMIACSVLLGVGVVGTGVSLGRLYQSQEFVKTTELREPLKASALNNIYVKTDVPLRIETTTGEPYVTFNNESVGITLPERTYALDVREEGDRTYITINEGSTFLDMTMYDEDKEAVLYLPEQTINRLQVEQKYQYYGNSIEMSSQLNINELVVDSNRCDLELEGNYNIIDIYSRDGGDIDITSNTPAEVKIKTDYSNGQVQLSGQYKDVFVSGGYNEVTINSSTPYNTIIKGGQGKIELKGEIEVAQVETYNGNLVIDALTVPKRLQVDGSHTEVQIKLPETITGFEALYTSEYQEDQTIYSNFDVKSENIKENVKKITYGDGSLDMLLNINEGELYILK